MFKKTLMTLALVSASAVAQAQDLQNLIDTSGSLKQTFDAGIRSIGGMADLARQGIISPNGMVDSGKVTQAQADAYNAAVNDVQFMTWGINAQEYIDQQAQSAEVDMADALNAYVGAASVLIEVVKVNEMAAEAQASGDVTQQEAVTNYVATNDVTLETQEIDTYNDSMDTLEDAAQTFAAFTAVAVNTDAVAQMQTDADAIGQNFVNANDATFDESLSEVQVSFFQGNSGLISVNVGYAFATPTEVLDAGAVSDFYTTGPTQNTCFFASPEEFEDPNSPCYSGAPTPNGG